MTVVTNRMANFWISWATGQTGRPCLRGEQRHAVSEGGRVYVLVNNGSEGNAPLTVEARATGSGRHFRLNRLRNCQVEGTSDSGGDAEVFLHPEYQPRSSSAPRVRWH